MSTRRAFFLSGGAALGAGVATAAFSSDHGSRALDPAADREAIRRLQLVYLSKKPSIAGRLEEPNVAGRLEEPRVGGWLEEASFHGAYRLAASERLDKIEIAADGQHASATFLVEIEVCTPIEGDCTAAQMARLQGNVASRHWESGRFDASYEKVDGEWQIASMSYRTLKAPQ